ncbi:MAG: type III glutamate--ammonia ligase [Planctomycetes bacterium]|nr:type III glutamate--ammonia ligase [Planctomycetota bacterium]
MPPPQTKPRKPAQVAAEMRRQGVKYGLASFVDIHGVPKGKIVPIDHWPQMFAGSELFTGFAVDGVPQRVNEEEVSAHPDPSAGVVCPWNRELAWFPSDLWCGGAPFPACSRVILKRQVEAARAMGYIMHLGIETEFFVLKDGADGRPQPTGPRDRLAKPCYDLTGFLDSYAWLDELVSAMNGLGWDVYSFDHEDANGQFETDFDYADALTMADRFTFFRMLVKEIVGKHGFYPTFMPKPFANLTGSGAHYNMSLADLSGRRNLFKDAKDPRGCGLSQLGYHFTAGVLRHAAAICCVIAPTVNSYKRLTRRSASSGFTWAPIYQCYGDNNRTNMLRIPLGGGRVECRAADIGCNLYLGAAMMLAAGLEGVRERLDPGEPNRDNMYLVAPDEIARRGIATLPQDLGEAADAFAADPLSKEVFGDAMFEAFTAFKRQEWAEYHAHVSDWEMNRYLKLW